MTKLGVLTNEDVAEPDYGTLRGSHICGWFLEKQLAGGGEWVLTPSDFGGQHAASFKSKDPFSKVSTLRRWEPGCIYY